MSDLIPPLSFQWIPTRTLHVTITSASKRHIQTTIPAPAPSIQQTRGPHHAADPAPHPAPPPHKEPLIHTTGTPTQRSTPRPSTFAELLSSPQVPPAPFHKFSSRKKIKNRIKMLPGMTSPLHTCCMPASTMTAIHSAITNKPDVVMCGRSAGPGVLGLRRWEDFEPGSG